MAVRVPIYSRILPPGSDAQSWLLTPICKSGDFYQSPQGVVHVNNIYCRGSRGTRAPYFPGKSMAYL